MTNVITDNIDIWTSAVVTKKSVGRGSSKKQEAYGIKKLHELILELAVRGKLVPQDPNDEPASVLLEKITEEKELLIKEGKIRKQKSLPEITEDEKIFSLPEKWQWTRLLNYYDVRDGTHDSPKTQLSGYPLVTSKNLYTGKLDLSDVKYISKEDYLKINERSKVDKGDILFAMIGSIGNPVIVNIDDEFSIKNVALFKYYNSELVVPRYLQIFLKLASIDMRKKATGGVQAFVSLGKLRSYVMPIPPLAEQHRIVAKVDELMALCDKLEEEQEENSATHQTLVETLLGTLTNVETPEAFSEAWQRIAEHFDMLFTTEKSIDKLQETILQLAVMGKLVPQDPDDEFASVLLEKIAEEKERLIKEGKIKKQKASLEITEKDKYFNLPKTWKWSRLGTLSIQITDGAHHTPTYIEHGVPFISVKDIDGKTISFNDCRYISQKQHEEINLRCNPELGDLLICRIGTLGRVTIVDTTKPFSLFVSVGLLKFVKRYFIPEFAHLVFHSPLLLDQYQEIKAGGSHTNKLNLRDLPRLMIPIAPLSEQGRIVAKVDELMALCDTLRLSLKELQTIQIHLSDTVAKQLSE